MSDLPAKDPHEEERRHRARYATTHSDPAYRPLQGHAYAAHARHNRDLYGGRLKEVHIDFLQTAHRSVCQFRPTTGYGAAAQMLINDGLALGANRQWVARPFPSPGFCRGLDDCVLKLLPRQGCLELRGLREGDPGFPAALTAECNRLGVALGLPPVRERRRAGDPDDEPVVAGWPFNVRPEGYYLGDLTEDFLSLAAGGSRPGRGHAAPPAQSIYEFFHHLSVTGQHDRLRKIFERQRDFHDARRLARVPGLRRIEAGELDVDGKTELPEVEVRAEWLLAENWRVAHMALGIFEHRSFADLPILADALQDAGCDDDFLLRHLYARIAHTHRCFALRKLVEAARRLDRNTAGGEPAG